jgi:hypothetical protein
MSARGPIRLAVCCVALAAIAGACSSKDGKAPTQTATTATTSAPELAPTEARAAVCKAIETPLHAVRTTDASAAVATATLLGADREIALLADEDARAIHVFDDRTLEELGATPTRGRPHQIRVLADGRVAVTEHDPERLVLYGMDAPNRAMTELCAMNVASDPQSIAETKSELLVSSGYGAALTRLDLRDLSPIGVVHLPPEPRSIVVDPAKPVAYVSHAILGRVSVVDLSNAGAADVKAISLGSGHVDSPLPDESKKPRASSQAFAIAPVAESEGHPFHLLVPNTTVDPGTKARTITATYGGGRSGTMPVAPIVSTIDPSAMRSITTAAEAAGDARDGSCLLPRSAVVRGDALFVACLDLGEVVEYDATLVDPSVLVLRRFAVPVGPSALALTSGGDLVVWSEIDGQISLVDPSNESRAPKKSARPWARDGFEKDPVIARGRYLFHTSRDPRLSFQRACASCHPDGRADGLSWSSPDGLRQTPMLAGRLDGTAPYGWNGEHATLDAHIEATVLRLGGDGIHVRELATDRADMAALIAYVRSIPAPAPNEASGDGPTVTRGAGIFADVCGSCHAGGRSDQLAHGIPVSSGEHALAKIDTPSLARVSGSGPYFHDGRYESLEDVVSATDGAMFDAGTLSDADKPALLAYLRTL